MSSSFVGTMTDKAVEEFRVFISEHPDVYLDLTEEIRTPEADKKEIRLRVVDKRLGTPEYKSAGKFPVFCLLFIKDNST